MWNESCPESYRLCYRSCISRMNDQKPQYFTPRHEAIRLIKGLLLAEHPDERKAAIQELFQEMNGSILTENEAEEIDLAGKP
jgi:hypothetical protein